MPIQDIKHRNICRSIVILVLQLY